MRRALPTKTATRFDRTRQPTPYRFRNALQRVGSGAGSPSWCSLASLPTTIPHLLAETASVQGARPPFRRSVCDPSNIVIASPLNYVLLLTGETFTVADAYCFTLLNWAHFAKIDLGRWPNLKTYVERVAARPKVREAMQAEGLLRAA